MNNILIILSNEHFASAPKELSEQLFVNYFSTLLSEELYPSVIFIYGSGVKVLNDSNVQTLFQKISKQGVQILYCKTCLNFYALDYMNGLSCGTVATMIDLVQLQQKAKKIIYL